MSNSIIFIPKNVVQSNKIMGFRKRNIAEGVLGAGVWVWFIWQIPFVNSVKWVLIVVVGLVILGVNLVGIKGNPISSTLFNFIRYRKVTKQFSFRRVSAEYRAEPIFDENTRQVSVLKTWTPSTGIEAFFEKFKDE